MIPTVKPLPVKPEEYLTVMRVAEATSRAVYEQYMAQKLNMHEPIEAYMTLNVKDVQSILSILERAITRE